jgi:trypsin
MAPPSDPSSRWRRSRATFSILISSAMLSQCGRWVVIGVVTVCALARDMTTTSYGVVGGTPTAASKYQNTGELVTRLFGSTIFLCTATAITPRVLITAAHCVAAWSAQPLDFTLSADVRSAHDWASVSAGRAYLNPAYDLRANGLLHDIALVELDAPLEGLTGEHVIDPADAVTLLRPGVRIELVGYGRIRADEEGLLGTKNAAQATITGVSANEITIGAPGAPQNCEGDSGGAAFLVGADGARRLVGIVSRSANDATDCVDGSIHTRVDAYADWIVATLHTIDESFQHLKRGEGGREITPCGPCVITFKHKL